MDITGLKIKLLNQLIECKDESVLRSIELLLNDESDFAFHEQKAIYETENAKVFSEENQKRWNALKSGEITALDWQDSKKMIFEKLKRF